MEHSVVSAFVGDLGQNGREPEHGESGFQYMLQQYEEVIVRSLITSFGLEAFIKDRRGGDVDTIQTVRDPSVEGYASEENRLAYENRGAYNPDDYHATKEYRSARAEVSRRQNEGNLYDAYSGQKLAPKQKVDLDHTISAKEIHDDPGRVLAGLQGPELANADSNLNPTARPINRSKRAQTASEFAAQLDKGRENRIGEVALLKGKESLTDAERKRLEKLEALESVDRERLMGRDQVARNEYERKLAKAYYTSPEFLKSTAAAGLKRGAQLGVRQALGLILAEVWLAARQEFPKVIAKVKESFDLKTVVQGIGDTIKRAFAQVRNKYKDVIAALGQGAVAGVLSSISSTLINIFLTTAKNVRRILRESWAAIVESVKILVFNPDNLPFGEMLRSVMKILSTAVSVIIGGLVQEAVSKINVPVPVLGDVLPIFLGSLVTGILSVTMLYFLDHSKTVQKVVEYANQLKDRFDQTVDYYAEVNQRLARYVAELEGIDYQSLERKVRALRKLNMQLGSARNPRELNRVLRQAVHDWGIEMPYRTLAEMDAFMLDESTVLII